MRHAVLANSNVDFHAWVVNLAQHFFDASNRLTKQSGWLRQFNHHHLPRFTCANAYFGNQNVLAIALVFRGHNPNAAFIEQAADDGLSGTLQNFNDTTFRSAFSVLSDDANFDTVFVQHGTHFVGRQENIAITIVTNEKAMSIAVALHTAFDLIEQS